jgi:MerR family copper efflux transcriptional regulator
MTTYRISEAARRTGLPTSTLRYYERIGLLPAPERTDSGYRAYEERALERLAFIARARDLGLRLDEIGGLADLWDAERCGPVQHRLRELISAKVIETEQQAAALTSLSAELTSFITGLDNPSPDAPCGPDCGCQPKAQPSLTMLPVPGPDLACSLDGVGQADRLAEWQALAAQATKRTPIEGGLRLTFAGADLRAMADLVHREQDCCSFLSFAIGVTPRGTTLDISGPVDARPLIEALG